MRNPSLADQDRGTGMGAEPRCGLTPPFAPGAPFELNDCVWLEWEGWRPIAKKGRKVQLAHWTGQYDARYGEFDPTPYRKSKAQVDAYIGGWFAVIGPHMALHPGLYEWSLKHGVGAKKQSPVTLIDAMTGRAVPVGRPFRHSSTVVDIDGRHIEDRDESYIIHETQDQGHSVRILGETSHAPFDFTLQVRRQKGKRVAVVPS